MVIRQAGRGEATHRAAARPGPAEARSPGCPPAALAVTRRQPGALARVASAAAVALVGRRLGPLRRALGRVRPLGDRRGVRPHRAGRPRHGAVIGGVQVSAGLLLLSVSAVTSLAEDRQRGSLDVLLATPLSTRSIVLGKWWGAFRGVPLLAVLPVLIAAALRRTPGSPSARR